MLVQAVVVKIASGAPNRHTTKQVSKNMTISQKMR